jgi:hypothetical protein
MSDKSVSSEVQVAGTRRAGEKFPDLHPVVPFVENVPDDDDTRPQVTLKVWIDPALGDERSNLTEIKMDMLKDLHGQSARYVHTRYLFDKLVFTKQGITGETDCFKRLHIFESLLGPKTKSTFASLLSRAVEEVFKQKGWLMTKTHIARLKKDPSLFDALLNNRGDSKIKLSAEAGTTDEEKENYFLQQYQKFERYVYWFLGKMVFKDHRNCLDNHKDYVLNDIVKPKCHHLSLTCKLHV